MHFPYDIFDPTPYLASIPQETILRHLDLKAEPSPTATSPGATKNFDIPEASNEEETVNCAIGPVDPTASLRVDQVQKNSSTKGPSTLERRKRLISTSLIKTPVMDGDLVDYHKHRLKPGFGEFDLKYKLYAVVVSI